MLSACQDEELRAGVSGVLVPGASALNLGNGTVMFKGVRYGVPGLGRMFDPFCAVSWVGRYLGRDHPRDVTLELSILYPT